MRIHEDDDLRSYQPNLGLTIMSLLTVTA